MKVSEAMSDRGSRPRASTWKRHVPCVLSTGLIGRALPGGGEFGFDGVGLWVLETAAGDYRCGELSVTNYSLKAQNPKAKNKVLAMPNRGAARPVMGGQFAVAA